MTSTLRRPAENLRALRELRGISLSSLSEMVAIPEQELLKIEQGKILPPHVVAKLADFYKLNINFLASGSSLAEGGDINQSGSIFFLQGASALLYREDLPKLNRAAQRARLFVGTTELGREGLIQRHRFEPQPIANDQQNNAARQGYRLARHVRTKLNLGVDPLPNLGSLLSGSLGVFVVEERLTDRGYQACAVLDRDRSAAAILLGPTPHNLSQRTLLRRVYLAHELCHILFDTPPKSAIAISTDGERGEREGSGDAVEQRARAFAAELLIPRDGLISSFGGPHLHNAKQAIDLVDRVRHYFGAPWKVVVNHLKNMGYIDGDTREKLEANGMKRPPAPQWLTEPASVPIDFQTSRPITPDQLAEEVWEAARSAAGEFSKELDSECTITLIAMGNHLSLNQPEHAKMALLSALDRGLRRSSIGLVQRLLARHDLMAGPPGAITGAMMVTRPAKELLGAAREEYLRRARTALKLHHAWSDERIDAAILRLG